MTRHTHSTPDLPPPRKKTHSPAIDPQTPFGSEETDPPLVTVPQHRPGRGMVTGCDLANTACLHHRFQPGPFFRLRPPLCRAAMTLSLELAAMTYHLEVDDWMAAGWTDVSIQIDNTLQSGLTRGESTSGEQMRTVLNNWKINRAKRALRERNPIAQLVSAFRQREKSDTIKAVTMLREAEPGKFVIAIGFMGTGSRFYDWFSNLRFVSEDGFHKGFTQLTDYFEQSADSILFPDTAAQLGLKKLTLADILQEMQRANSRFFLWMAGHSQGAAVMQIFCHKLVHQWGVLPENMIGYGFASPTVATGQLLYDPACYPIYHVLNSDDIVPRMGALLHLGLCLEYPADDPFRKAAYGWAEDQAALQVREALIPFAQQMTDTLSIMEFGIAFCYCIVEEKGEESLSSLIDKKWTLAPIEKALTYAGDKAQDVVAAIARYAKGGYESLAGHGMEDVRLEQIKGHLRPLVRQFTLRQLFTGLHSLTVPPHMIMRDHFQFIGSYSYINQRKANALRPFIWKKRRNAIPAKVYGDTVLWLEDMESERLPTSTRHTVRRRRPSKSHPSPAAGTHIKGRKRKAPQRPAKRSAAAPTLTSKP